MNQLWERESRLTDNYSKVPHGLWTADLTYGAKCLLGWLHSHTSSYLATLTARRIRDEFGCSAVVAKWIDELATAGFVEVIPEKNRQRFRLKAAPWDALAARQRPFKRSESDHSDSTPERHHQPETVEKRPINGQEMTDKRSRNDHIEDHVGDHVEEHTLAHASVSTRSAPGFDRFWSTYPRKVGKGAARNRWTRMSEGDRKAALDAAELHAERWRRERTEVRFIPHPATWLGQQRWLDDLTTEARHEPTMPSAVRHAADLLARVRAQSSDHADEERRLELAMTTEEDWL